MSIALLTQVYDETRRLAIAGSVVAPGDFRLKKLIPPLEQVGAKAPVFAKVAEQVKSVVEATDKTSATALLDLATLMSAVLYTQGDAGIEGDLQPIETTDLGLIATKTGARTLKPLLEALTTKGSGRLETIRDACERDLFRDMRLIQPAVAAIDDSYPEIADMIVEKVLPLYGKAILTPLRTTFDLKGKTGDARRLRLMHRLDPVGSRELVKQALENGSKEVKVAAVECLGQDRDDLSLLLEQAAAKAQDVRQAAYRALARFEEDEAVAILKKAFDGKELEFAVKPLRESRSPKLLNHMIAGIRKATDELASTKDKKEVSDKATRLATMIGCLAGRDDADSEAVILEMFGRRESLAQRKGATYSGADLNSGIVGVMAQGSSRLVSILVEQHASLPAHDLGSCFAWAMRTLPPEKVYECFSPYLTTKGDTRKKGTNVDKRSEILEELMIGSGGTANESAKLDPRWLDLAVALEDANLVSWLIRPGHEGAICFLSKSFGEQMKKGKLPYDAQETATAMIRGKHPDAADATVALIDRFADKAHYSLHRIGSFISELPRSALPRLEALIPKLNEPLANELLGWLQPLRDKSD
ncbi:MAG: HEAT repeat domain-containing protein [Gemmataceae bacterium]|nr:HEAT repeat domain-containing protein [Gemmataceae bacterium]